MRVSEPGDVNRSSRGYPGRVMSLNRIAAHYRRRARACSSLVLRIEGRRGPTSPRVDGSNQALRRENPLSCRRPAAGTAAMLSRGHSCLARSPAFPDVAPRMGSGGCYVPSASNRGLLPINCRGEPGGDPLSAARRREPASPNVPFSTIYTIAASRNRRISREAESTGSCTVPALTFRHRRNSPTCRAPRGAEDRNSSRHERFIT